MDQTLYQNIAKSTAHRPSRDFNSNYIFEKPDSLQSLMEIAFDLTDKNHHKACWVTELVFEKHIDWLAPYLDRFCAALSSYTHDGALRSFSKICLFAAMQHSKSPATKPFLSETQAELIITACFDWLIGDAKVATKAYAMRALFLFGKQHDWIYPELKEILPKDFMQHSAAYHAVAKDLLARMK